MRHDKLQLQLDLLLMLTENNRRTISELCDELGISRRNMYYYLEFFKQAGFHVSRHGSYYSIDRKSPFIEKLTEAVSISEDEAIMLKRLLEQSDQRNLQVRSVLNKLNKFYDFNILENDPLRQHQARLASKIYKAIKQERMMVIKGYSSPHSQSVSSRLVEPFLLMNGSADLRAYEPQSKMNKTFKLIRMEDVDILEEEWLYRKCHRQMYTDIFNFASDDLTPVTLLLDSLACSVLLEEHPKAQGMTEKTGDNEWTFRTEVCSMLGIGRFVLGLYDHIKIIDSPALSDYINQKLQQFVEAK